MKRLMSVMREMGNLMNLAAPRISMDRSRIVWRITC